MLPVDCVFSLSLWRNSNRWSQPRWWKGLPHRSHQAQHRWFYQHWNNDIMQNDNCSNFYSMDDTIITSRGRPGKGKIITWYVDKKHFQLKTLDTIGNHMHTIKNLWKIELNWSSKLRENNERKTPLSHEVICFQMLDFETSKSKSEVSKSSSWKITSFSNTTLLRWVPFLTMFFTIIFDTKIYFEWLPIVSLPLIWFMTIFTYWNKVV